MIYILAQESNITKIKEVVSINKSREGCCEVSRDRLIEMGHVETLVVDWNCYKMLRSMYRVVSIKDLAFVIGDYYIDSSDVGKRILSDYEKKALKNQNWHMCKIINHIRTEFSFWKRDIEIENYPNLIQIESTNVCNAKCIMCKHLISNNHNGGFITMDVLKKISNIFPYVDIVILHGFGEPFLTPQIKEMIEFYMSYGIKLITNTNLSILPNDVVPMLNDAFYQINVSCDGCTKETFEGIRKGLNFEDFNKNVMILKEKCPDVKLIMNTVMMRQNLFELSEIVRYAKRMGFEEIGFMSVTVDYSLDNYDDGLVNYPQITYKVIEDIKLTAKEEKIKAIVPDLKIDFCEEEYCKELEKYKRTPRFKGDEEINIIQERARKNMRKPNEEKVMAVQSSDVTCLGICNWVIEKTTMDLSGNIYYCCMNIDHTERDVVINSKIRNVCETDFSDIWNGLQYKKIREMFYSGRLPEVCVGCQFLMNKLIETVDIQVEGDMFLTRKG